MARNNSARLNGLASARAVARSPSRLELRREALRYFRPGIRRTCGRSVSSLLLLPILYHPKFEERQAGDSTAFSALPKRVRRSQAHSFADAS